MTTLLRSSKRFLSDKIDEDNVDVPFEEEGSMELSLSPNHARKATIRKANSYRYGLSHSLAALDSGPSSPQPMPRRAVTPNPIGTHTPLLTPSSSSSSPKRNKNKLRGSTLAAFLEPPLAQGGVQKFKRKSTILRQAEDPVRRPTNHLRDRNLRKSRMQQPGDDLKINKLQFSSLGLYGRERQHDTLTRCLDRMMEGAEDVTNTLATPTFLYESSAFHESHFFHESLHESTGGSGNLRPGAGGNNHSANFYLNSPRQQKQLVFVSGYSGTGKTALATAIERDVWKKGGALITGKFDLYLRDEPYTGIASACEELCSYIIRLLLGNSKNSQTNNINSSSNGFTAGDDNTNSGGGGNNNNNRKGFEHLSSRTAGEARMAVIDIIEELGDELPILTRVIPKLKELLGRAGGGVDAVAGRRGSGQHKQTEEEQDQQHGYFEAKNRFNYAFKRFIRVLCGCFSPLVLVLDDLQWADLASLDLLEVLITDTGNPYGLMVIGCYRSNEVDAAHILTTSIRDIKSKKSEQRRRHLQVQASQRRLAGHSSQSRFGIQQRQDEQNNTTSTVNVNDFFDITEIHVGNLNVEDVNSMVMDLLADDDKDRTWSLAKICHKKTGGNVFFLIRFMAMLVEMGLLTFNIGLLKWLWKDHEIANETLSTENVVDLMKEQMNKLPVHMSRLLQLTACLGSTFEERTLRTVWADFCKRESSRDHLEFQSNQQELCLHNQPAHRRSTASSSSRVSDDGLDIKILLSFLIEEGYIYFVSGSAGRYRWVHDKIQEAAFSLIPENEVHSIQSRVGFVLVAQLTRDELEAGIFVVVNLLNAGFEDSKSTESTRKLHDRRIMLAELNLKASKKAIKLSAFESAQKYAVKGIEMLPEDRWEKQYILTLELYNTAAETEGYLGLVDEMKMHCNEVLDHRRSKVRDKLRVYNVLMDSLYIREDLHAATKLCLDVLKMLGCEFPKGNITRKILTLWGAFRIKATMKYRTAKEMSSLPLLKEPDRIDVMRLLDKLVTYCYVTGNNLLPLVVFRNLQWSLRYGLCLASPPSYALAGAILAGSLHDFKGGKTYGENGLVSLQNLHQKLGDQSRAVESRTILIVYSFVLPWTSPLHGMVKPLFRGYEVGMQTGDTDSAFWAICHYLLIGFHSGRPLHALEADCVTYVQQGKELKREQQVGYITLLWQTILNLRHQVDNPVVLTGEVMDQDKCMHVATSTGNPVLMGWIEALQSQLCAFFGDHEVGAHLAVQKGDRLAQVMAASPHVAVDPFCSAISLFSMARMTRQKNFEVRSRKMATTIKSWVVKGNPNVRQLDLILDAELAALAGKELVARKHYQDAIVMSARCGFIHHAALANERYGEYMFYVVKDNDEAEYRFEQAVKYYQDWGAGAKADMLRTKYQRLMHGASAVAAPDV